MYSNGGYSTEHTFWIHTFRHALDVPFGVDDLLKVKIRSKKVKEGFDSEFRFRSISRKPFHGFQPYYT
jgi:hypothetical protein